MLSSLCFKCHMLKISDGWSQSALSGKLSIQFTKVAMNFNCFSFSLQNFTIIYIKMGYPRLEVGKQCELAPTLLTAMEGKPQPQQDWWGEADTNAFAWFSRHFIWMTLCFPLLCYNLSSFSLSPSSLMHLLIPTLYYMKYPTDSLKSASLFNLTERPKTVQLLQEFMLDVLLMPYG